MSVEYVCPENLDDVLAVLSQNRDGARALAGGTDLLVDMRAGLKRPEILVDLKGVDALHRISFDSKEGLSIGACVTVNELLDLPAVGDHYRILTLAGRQLATHVLRNRATVAGNIVTASPCGDMSSPLLCLEAQIVVRSRFGSRTIPFAEFIKGVKETVLTAGEVVERILIPTTMADAAAGYEKLKRIKGHDLGVVAVAMVKKDDLLRLAISSAAPTPVLLKDFAVDTPLSRIQDEAQKRISPIDDVRCTKEYRAAMVNVFIERLVEGTRR